MRMKMKTIPGVPAMVALAMLGLLSYPAIAQHGGHGVGRGGGHKVGRVSVSHSRGHSIGRVNVVHSPLRIGRVSVVHSPLRSIGHVSVGHSAVRSFGHVSVGHSAGQSVSHLGGHGTLHLSVGHIGAGHVIRHSGQNLLHIGLHNSSLHNGYSPYRWSYPSYSRTRYKSSNPVVLVVGTTIPEAPRTDDAPHSDNEPRSDDSPHSDNEPRSSSDGIGMSIPLVEALEAPEVLPPLDDEGEVDPYSADDHSQEAQVHEEPH